MDITDDVIINDTKVGIIKVEGGENAIISVNEDNEIHNDTSTFDIVSNIGHAQVITIKPEASENVSDKNEDYNLNDDIVHVEAWNNIKVEPLDTETQYDPFHTGENNISTEETKDSIKFNTLFFLKN